MRKAGMEFDQYITEYTPICYFVKFFGSSRQGPDFSSSGAFRTATRRRDHVRPLMDGNHVRQRVELIGAQE